MFKKSIFIEGWEARPRPPQPRGTALIMGMILVTTMAMLSLLYASRITGNVQKMDTEVASAQALELAQSALDLTVTRLYTDFEKNMVGPNTGMNWLKAELHKKGTTPTTSKKYDRVDLQEGQTLAWGGEGDDNSASWEYFGGTSKGAGEGGQVKVYVRYIDNVTTLPAGAGEYIMVEFKARARFKSYSFENYQYREITRIAQFSENLTTPTPPIPPPPPPVPPPPGNKAVFNFSYFVNNFGWMWGSPIYIHGNVGSNANLSFKYGPTVNGYLFAAVNPALNSAGTINNGMPKHDSLTSYLNKAASNSMMPPANPSYWVDSNSNGTVEPDVDTVQDYALGYPGTQEVKTGSDPLPMPYLGDLTQYKQDAINLGGTVKQLKAPGLDPNNPDNYNILVSAVYGDDDGENGMISTQTGDAVTVTPLNQKLDESNQEKNGNAAFIGTAAQPLVIDGPVVITNDLALKGVVKGQGTFYTGRNLHVAGNIEYSDKTAWNGNDPAFTATEEANKQKDLVGYAVKGSIILGQYTRYNTGSDDSWNWTVNTFFKGNFADPSVQAYQSDPTDESIGYYDPLTETFHGNYKADDGGKRYSANEEIETDDTGAPATVNRRYYESSFSHEYFASIATSRPTKLHGIFYTNHLIGGRMGKTEILGSIVARDEGIVFNTRLDMYYDPRSSSSGATSSSVSINLPNSTIPPTVPPPPSGPPVQPVAAPGLKMLAWYESTVEWDQRGLGLDGKSPGGE